MRLWSISLKYLDKVGYARWRKETKQAIDLFERNGMRKDGKGISPYWRHSGLERWKKIRDPIIALLNYSRPECCYKTLPVTSNQLTYEFNHLQKKLYAPVYRKGKMIKKHRNLAQYRKNIKMVKEEGIIPHPFFRVVAGEVEQWERVKK